MLWNSQWVARIVCSGLVRTPTIAIADTGSFIYGFGAAVLVKRVDDVALVVDLHSGRRRVLSFVIKHANNRCRLDMKQSAGMTSLHGTSVCRLLS